MALVTLATPWLTYRLSSSRAA